MKLKEVLENTLDKDIIKKIYYNDYNFSDQLPKTKEYKILQKDMRKQENKLLCVESETFSNDFKFYLEMRNMKDDLEAENQFELGFKTAIQLIVNAVK